MDRIELGSSLTDGKPVVIESQVISDDCVIVGAKGSGKTTLGQVLLGEVLGQGYPVVMFDTTGDMTHWLQKQYGLPLLRGLRDAETDEASAEGVQIDLRSIDVDSVAGIFSVPDGAEAELSERLLDEVQELVAALLGLLGYKIRRMAPEFVLTESIVAHEWRAGRDVALRRLADLIEEPPFRVLGLFGVDEAIPRERRKDLALAIRSLLESPGFSSMGTPEAISVQRLLFDGAGPRGTVLSFAQRYPRARQFLVAVLLAKLETYMTEHWSGNDLELMLYLDEASAFLPRNQTVITTEPLIRALGDWDSFGVGVVLVAESPEELNEIVEDLAETWFVGSMPVAASRRLIVDALDLVNPPVDQVELDASIKRLEAGQFVMRSSRLPSLQKFQTKRL